MTRLDDAISHLTTALRQALPTDDAIIVGHMRDALALLRAERDVRRESERDYAEWARQTECHD